MSTTKPSVRERVDSALRAARDLCALIARTDMAARAASVDALLADAEVALRGVAPDPLATEIALQIQLASALDELSLLVAREWVPGETTERTRLERCAPLLARLLSPPGGPSGFPHLDRALASMKVAVL